MSAFDVLRNMKENPPLCNMDEEKKQLIERALCEEFTKTLINTLAKTIINAKKKYKEETNNYENNKTYTN